MRIFENQQRNRGPYRRIKDICTEFNNRVDKFEMNRNDSRKGVLKKKNLLSEIQLAISHY